MKALILVALAGFSTALVQDASDARDEVVLPTVGKPAPPLRLNDHTGTIATVGGQRESWSVLAFYPKASTPGCTSEVCSLRDSLETLGTIGAEVYGISLDSVQDQAAFAEKQGLNFPLLSDPDASAARKYGVLDASGQYTKRVTFVIDDKGILRAIVDPVSVKTHGEDLAGLIESLRGE